MAEISPLRRRMIEHMTVRNLSPATQQSYLNAISKFSRYFGRSPDRLNVEDVHAFQVHLVATGISWPALNQIVCALRFFYGVTLGQVTVPERIAYAREPGLRSWTLVHARWLSNLTFEHSAQYLVLREYRQAIEDAEARLERLTRQVANVVST